MIYDYVNTKPPLNEKTLEEYGATIQHGWLKDQAAKIHKYIKRWKGPNGKWYYQYAVNTAKKAGNNLKLKALDLRTKFNRRIRGMSPDQISMKNGTFTFARKDDGKALSTTRPYGNRVYNGERELYNNGYSKKSIEKNYKGGSPMGSSDHNAYYRRKEKAENQTRKEAKQGKQKTEKIKSSGYKQGNLSNRGFSDSKSGGNNAATNKSSVIRKNKNSKSLTNKGYYDSKKSTPYQKKPSLGVRGFPSSRQLSDYDISRARANKLYGKPSDFQNYIDKSGSKGYVGPLKLAPEHQDIFDRHYQNRAYNTGWITAGRKRAKQRKK